MRKNKRSRFLLSRLRGIGIETDLRPYQKVLNEIKKFDFIRSDGKHLSARAVRIRADLAGGADAEALLPEIFALTAEWSARLLRLRPFDTQLLAGIVLARGKLAEMATGEGKTLAAVFPAVGQALCGKGVHIMTANDYLARRDALWMGPVYRAMGLMAAFVSETKTADQRRAAYAADVSYVTARQAGFDFLRDSLARRGEPILHRGFDFAIVDEADFLLIDEARVPLVLAARDPDAEYDPVRVGKAAVRLTEGADFIVDRAGRSLHLTLAGERRTRSLLGIGGMHRAADGRTWAALHVALLARRLLARDTDYIVRNGRIEMVDELTGRIAHERRWPHGIQAALEVKEGLPVREQGRIYGSIVVQYFLSLYAGRAGLTATAAPAAEELQRFYGLATVVLPTHRPIARRDLPDAVFFTRRSKLNALLDEIAREQRKGRPILVGTRSVAESEELARLLRKRGLSCRVLNAKNDRLEASVVAHAGEPGALTISTNMAGRGTDIRLGGPDGKRAARVRRLGGLYVIGTNRHESVRIDRQLKGRAGRQGDPGASRFFVSLEDDLFRRYGVAEFLPRAALGKARCRPNAEIDDGRVRREIDRAQSIIGNQHYLMRRTLRRYSALVEEQRRVLAAQRRAARERGELPEELAALCGRARAGGREHCVDLFLAALDRFWADHLAVVEDLREGIHLQRYGGREPLHEFIRLASDAFAAGWRRAEAECAAACRVAVRGRRKAAAAARRPDGRMPASTWTYALDDEVLPAFSLGAFGGGFSIGVFTAMVLAIAGGLRRLVTQLRSRRARPG